MKNTINQFTGKTNSWLTDLTNAFNNEGLMSGQMLGYSKSAYSKAHQGEKFYFNACIYAIGDDKKPLQIWWGDINLTDSLDTLKAIAKETNQTFYVTPEHPYRSDFNEVTEEILKKDKEWVIKIES